MPTTFPSIDFLKALMQEAPEGSDALASLGDDEILFGVNVGQYSFTVELAEKACVAVALGGNANDMDFVLTGPKEGWLALLDAAEDEEKFASILRSGGPVEPEFADESGHERLAKALPALRTFFAGARSIEWSAD